MSYKQRHDEIISRAIEELGQPNLYSRSHGKVGYHQHHILPVSEGGDNEGTNIALLTIEQHFQVHYLRLKWLQEIKSPYIYKAAQTVALMYKTFITSGDYKVDSKLYSDAMALATEGKRIDILIRNKMIELYDGGMTKATDIGRSLGVSIGTVCKYIKESGREVEANALNSKQQQEVFDKYHSDTSLTLTDLAKQYSVDNMTIKAYVERGEFKSRSMQEMKGGFRPDEHQLVIDKYNELKSALKVAEFFGKGSVTPVIFILNKYNITKTNPHEKKSLSNDDIPDINELLKLETVSSIAGIYGMSVGVFNRCYESITNNSPRKYKKEIGGVNLGKENSDIIVEMYTLQKIPTKVIYSLTGISPQIIKSVFEFYGVVVPTGNTSKNKPSKSNLEEQCKLHKTQVSLSKHYKTTRNTISKWLKDYDIAFVSNNSKEISEELVNFIEGNKGYSSTVIKRKMDISIPNNYLSVGMISTHLKSLGKDVKCGHPSKATDDLVIGFIKNGYSNSMICEELSAAEITIAKIRKQYGYGDFRGIRESLGMTRVPQPMYQTPMGVFEGIKRSCDANDINKTKLYKLMNNDPDNWCRI